jgi:hypothetical protein
MIRVAVLLLLPLLIRGVAFMRGSLELFPTEEQQDKVRLVYGSLFALFAALELATVLCWYRRRSDEK